MTQRFGDANCRDCGALVRYVDHVCEPPDPTTFARLARVGQEAIIAEIEKLPDALLAKLAAVMTYASGDHIDRLLVKELARRFRKLVGVEADGQP